MHIPRTVLLCALSVTAANAAEQRFISIGTGGIAGVYHPIGGAICRLVNESHEEHGIRCSAQSTGGSIYNINTVRTGELEFGIAQSDWQYHAYNGTARFEEEGRFEDLRAVFSVHAEPLTLLARGGDIEDVEDLRGKRVHVGGPGTALRATTEMILGAHGMTVDDFAAAELDGPGVTRGLCDDEIDAVIYTVAHPATAITELSNTCQVDFVDVEGPAIDTLLAENPFYRIATIPAGTYTGQDEAVTTFGIGATVVSSASVPEEVVYIVTRAVFDSFEDFRRLHPAFAGLEQERMVTDGLSAPLHDGASRYFAERGWM